MSEDKKKTVKVLRIIARLNVGGPALHCVLLSENLDKHGYQTALVTGQPSSDEADYEKVFNIQPQNFRLIKLKNLRRVISGVGDLLTLFELIRIIRRERPEIVHTHTAKAGTLGRIAAFLTGVPVVVHTFHGHVLRGYFGTAFSKFICQIERMLAVKTTAIVTLSQGLKEELSEVFKLAPPHKFRVIPLGRELTSFFNNASFRGQLKKEFNLSDSDFVIGIIGRLVPIKNHGLLIEALSQLPKEIPWHLIVAGEGEERDALEIRVEQLGVRDRVHFLGWRSDLNAIYADLDLFTLSSLNEGTPLSIIESFASGVPVVSTDVGGVKDLFTPAPSDWTASPGTKIFSEGILVESGDTRALAAAIHRMASEKSLRTKMGESARIRGGNFSQENLTDRMNALYRELLLKHA